MKRAIIIRAEGHELANQLWNYSSIYAYALERGLCLTNPSFFEYGEYFAMPLPHSLVRAIFFLPFKNYTKRKTAFRRRVWRKLYVWYTNISMRINRKHILSHLSKTNTPYYLPPTQMSEGRLRELEEAGEDIYFDGWVFRNPKGLEKYHTEIRKYFRPRKNIEDRIIMHMNQLRSSYRHIVGVHLRQGDYKTWRKGEFFIEQQRAHDIMEEYLSFSQKKSEETCFLITSDGPVDEKNFPGLHVVISADNAVADLFLLSSTDAIIGSNSTFGAFASYYGNIPLIVMQKTPIDWDYYRDKKSYFENKYSTVVNY